MASEAVSPDDLDPEAELTELEFSIFGYVSRPRAEVYEAVADPLVLSKLPPIIGRQGVNTSRKRRQQGDHRL